MTTSSFPPSPRQVWLLALLMLAPLGVTIAAVSRSASAPALAILGAALLVLVAILVFVMTRHTVQVGGAGLTVRHSLYTFTMQRGAFSTATVRQVRTAGCLGLAARTNGIAAFGYLSGWFRTRDSRRAFCAVSQGPLYLVTFEGNAGCLQLALSADAETAGRIEAWAAAK